MQDASKEGETGGEVEDSMPRGQWEAHTAAILMAIKDTKTSLEAQIAAVSNEDGSLRDQQSKLTGRVKEAEFNLTALGHTVKTLTAKCASMEKGLQVLTDRHGGAVTTSQHPHSRCPGMEREAKRGTVC